MSAVPELAPDVKESLHEIAGWSAIEESKRFKIVEKYAGVVSCWQFGHPNQPRAKRKHTQQPWRCESWWVAVRDWDPYGSWYKWARVWKDD